MYLLLTILLSFKECIIKTKDIIMEIWALYTRPGTIRPKYIPYCQDPTNNESFCNDLANPVANPSSQWNSAGKKNVFNPG